MHPDLFEAWRHARMHYAAKAVLLYLLELAGGDGTCYPAQETIAADLGVSRSTVTRAMRVLCGSGLIVPEARRGKALAYRLDGTLAALRDLRHTDASSCVTQTHQVAVLRHIDAGGCVTQTHQVGSGASDRRRDQTHKTIKPKPTVIDTPLLLGIFATQAQRDAAGTEAVARHVRDRLPQQLRDEGIYPTAIAPCVRAMVVRWSQTGERPYDQLVRLRQGLDGVGSPAAVLARRLQDPRERRLFG